MGLKTAEFDADFNTVAKKVNKNLRPTTSAQTNNNWKTSCCLHYVNFVATNIFCHTVLEILCDAENGAKNVKTSVIT